MLPAMTPGAKRQADMNTNHTPGPWNWYPHADKCVATVQRDGRRIATVGDGGGGRTMADANAALIAAAPELVEALRYYASARAKAHGYDNGALARAAMSRAGI